MQLNELEMEPYTAAAATLAVNAPPPLPERPPSCNHIDFSYNALEEIAPIRSWTV